jgi:hypothetical protein
MEKRSPGRPRIYPRHIAKLNVDYNVAKTQAAFRNELWDITREFWLQEWLKDDRYLRKGRSADSFCFCRLDSTEAWTEDNCNIELRKTWLQRTARAKKGWGVRGQ